MTRGPLAVLTVLATLWPSLAFAHTEQGRAAGLLAGLQHPVSGLDHVLAMVSVGLWGAQLGAPAVWLLPVTFPMVMAFGGMLGLELKGGVRATERFLRALTIAAHAPSLGGVETLVSEPRLTSHAGITAEQRAQAGIPDGFLRFSLGLEDPDDLIADFAQALARL